MAPKLRHIRSTTLDKRPDPALLLDGQAAQNQAVESPGMFIKDAAGGLVKIGPAHVGPTAPNSTPQGVAGNSVGEQWLDTSVIPAVARIWSGSQWVSLGGGSTVTTDDVPPAAPADGDLWWDSASTTLFVWYDDGDSAQWVQIGGGAGGGGGGGSAQTTDTPPDAPVVGQLWWDAITTSLYIWYDDGDSAQWVQASPTQPGPAGADSTVPGPQGPAGADGAIGPAGPTAVSADVGNASRLGADGLIFTPASLASLAVTAPIANTGTADAPNLGLDLSTLPTLP
jgi:hypothetical protein